MVCENTDCREVALSEEAKKCLCEESTAEGRAEGTGINWVADVLWELGRKMPVQLTTLTAAFMHCYISGIMSGVNPSEFKVPEEGVRMAIGASCYEATEKALARLCGGKDDE